MKIVGGEGTSQTTPPLQCRGVYVVMDSSVETILHCIKNVCFHFNMSFLQKRIRTLEWKDSTVRLPAVLWLVTSRWNPGSLSWAAAGEAEAQQPDHQQSGQFTRGTWHVAAWPRGSGEWWRWPHVITRVRNSVNTICLCWSYAGNDPHHDTTTQQSTVIRIIKNHNGSFVLLGLLIPRQVCVGLLLVHCSLLLEY